MASRQGEGVLRREGRQSGCLEPLRPSTPKVLGAMGGVLLDGWMGAGWGVGRQAGRWMGEWVGWREVAEAEFSRLEIT